MTFRHAIPLLLALSAVAAGCGGNSASPGVANIGTSTSSASPSASGGSAGGGKTSKIADGARFSACMRSHGVHNFPDPGANGGLNISPDMGFDPSSPTFKAAERACRSLLHIPAPSPAEQAEIQEQALKFSQCMRSHGLPNFPDPQFSEGKVSLRFNAKSGMDPNSPVFQAAQKACEKEIPGAKRGPGGGRGGKSLQTAP
jgi:hypothetical protein